MSKKLYRVQMNNKGMPNFSTAEEVEPCKDAISRQWLINNIEKGEEVEGGVFNTDSDSVKNFINVAPSIMVEPKQGEWKGYNADKGGDWLRDDGTPVFLVCDKCYGTVINNGSAHWNFCPNCGCRMKGADDE